MRAIANLINAGDYNRPNACSTQPVPFQNASIALANAIMALDRHSQAASPALQKSSCCRQKDTIKAVAARPHAYPFPPSENKPLDLHSILGLYFASRRFPSPQSPPRSRPPCRTHARSSAPPRPSSRCRRRSRAPCRPGWSATPHDALQDPQRLLRRIARLLLAGGRHDRVPPDVGRRLAARRLLRAHQPGRHVRDPVALVQIEHVPLRDRFVYQRMVSCLAGQRLGRARPVVVRPDDLVLKTHARARMISSSITLQ